MSAAASRGSRAPGGVRALVARAESVRRRACEEKGRISLREVEKGGTSRGTNLGEHLSDDDGPQSHADSSPEPESIAVRDRCDDLSEEPKIRETVSNQPKKYE